MKAKKVIGELIVILILMLAFCTFSTSTFAREASYVLGITNVREAQNGKLGAAYGIGGLKSDNTPTKKVWKIVSYPSTGVINYSNAFYCIKAEHGFASNTGSGDVSSIRKTYDTSFNMKTQKNEVITRLNTINTNIGHPALSNESYNKIMWIIDNMYLPKSDTATQDKEKLLTAAEIIGENGYESGLQLTDDDIEVVQQLALWYFTNASDTNYHQNGSDSQAILQTLLFNNWSGTDSGYRNFADLYDDRVLDTRLGTDRQNQAEDLYRYFINNARGDYNVSQTVVSPITLNKSGFTATQVGENYIIGPLSISVDKTKNYNISKAVFKDQNGNTISLTGENKLLNSNKEHISDNTIKLGEEFYLSLPITTNITKVGFEITGTYKITSATYYTTSQSTYAGEQPVVLVEKANENYRDNIEIGLPAPRYLDLALRKSITKIGNASPSVNRLPRVDTGSLIPKGTDKTAKYNHPKNALTVETNQFIEYTITVYNEGQKNGYAQEIKDYLPAGIEFVELVTPLDKYTATEVKNADGTSVVTITNTGKKVLNKYTSGIPESESFIIRCKITAKIKGEDQVLVNIAEITKYFDSELGSEVSEDRDSQPANFPSNLKNNNYRGNGQDGNYIPGQQDDDDFEPVVLKGKELDLALRKFIIKVNNREPEQSRVPVPVVTNLIPNGTSKNAVYKHPKNPVPVKVGDIVTYKIRVYNEGPVSGYAQEIKDHLPEYLEFLDQDEENIANGWIYDEEDLTLRTIKTNHLSKEMDEEENLIKAFDGTTLDYKEVIVKCRVKQGVISEDIITNIADIADYADEDGDKLPERDSTEDNVVLPSDEQLPEYIGGKETNKDLDPKNPESYFEGQEDDDDFEKLIVQRFDLALRKFITAVNNKSVTTRIPVPTMGEDGNIKYNHTKEPVEVQTNNIVTYTLRIFNEGDISGYASEITDNLPEGLLYLPENELNKTYRWKMIDEAGNETQDVEKAVKVTTDYLSKEQEKEDGSNLIKAYNKAEGITNENPDYKDIKIAFKVIEPNTSDRILTNIAEISDDQDEHGNPVEDDDSTPGNNDPDEDDIDVEHVKLTYFDLALRKFITKIDNLDVNNRYPKLEMGEDGNIKYVHTKEPMEVENGNIVTYTIRVYNEGKMDGYASEITDDLPKGLLYLPENETNKEYDWKMIDKDGKETKEVEKAVKITTDYLSIAKEKTAGENLIKAYDKELGITDKNPDYRDVLIAFKVTEPETSDRILINTAEISEDTDPNGDPVDDIDSTPDNEDPDEDDIDIEKVKVKYFDLALKKWVSKAILIENGNKTVTDTGHTGDENPEPVVKVDLKDKKLNKVTVKFEYKIKVTNEGQIAGYATELKDHIPDGLVFEKEDNPDWEVFDEGIVVTNKLKDTLLKPGESAEVTIILTWVNSQDNLGLKVNIAEISKDKNDSDTPDIDSTPDNFKPEEDDQDDAPVILSVKTGEIRFYITLTAIVLVTLAGGVILIKKYVL